MNGPADGGSGSAGAISVRKKLCPYHSMFYQVWVAFFASKVRNWEEMGRPEEGL